MQKSRTQSSAQALWYGLENDEVADKLQVVPDKGLSQQEAHERLIRFGKNRISFVRKRTLWQLLLTQFSDFMILVLIAAAIISGYVGEPIDSIAIVVIVLLNAVIGFVQDYRAEKALEALREMAAKQARVRRDGAIKEIPADELVPGDVVLLEAGNIVPADLRLLEVALLELNEAALTGESQPVEKIISPLSGERHSLGDRINLAYKGCVVSRGRGVGLCTATGMQTEFGKIAAMLQKGEDNKTPLQHRLTRFGKRLSLIILAICALIFVIGLLRGEPPALMFLTAVSLAVAAIPEALPAVVTISLALGAKRMVKSNALIRRLPAVEALGSVTWICTDKTGTLTQNRMSLEAVFAEGTLHESLGTEGNSWQLLGKALALNNDVETDADGAVVGEPTEIALYEAAQKAGFDKQNIQKTLPRIGEIPFDSTRKLMTTVHKNGNSFISFTKGAPEILINISTNVQTSTAVVPLQKEELAQTAASLAEKGYRVLAIAYRNWESEPGAINSETLENGVTLLALLALIDPPRPEAKQAVATCREAGITPVMITGDHPSTALAIANQIGIAGEDDQVISGEMMAKLSDDELKAIVREKAVYARVNPEEKIRIVAALQSHGQFVAMTGDGVNDAPALKHADVGVAMGKIGTEVAREASDLVLLDDNFSTIVTVVREGRRIFDNIRKFIKYTMTSNSGEILTLLLAPFLGMPIPLLPIHILWINLVTDGLPGLALSVEPEEKAVMQRPPRPADESIFAHGMWQHMVWVGFLIAGLSLFSLAWANYQESGNWQTMVFTTLTFSQLVHVMVIRSETESLFRLGLRSNPALLVTVILTVMLQLIVIYTPALQAVFKTQALSLFELVLCTSLASVVFIAVEIEKWMIRKGWIYHSSFVKK